MKKILANILVVMMMMGTLNSYDEFDQYNVDENYEALQNNDVYDSLTDEEKALLLKEEEEKKKKEEEEKKKADANNILSEDNWKIVSDPYIPNSNNSKFRGATASDFNDKGELVDTSYNNYTTNGSTVSTSTGVSNSAYELKVGDSFDETMTYLNRDTIYYSDKLKLREEIEGRIDNEANDFHSKTDGNIENGVLSDSLMNDWGEKFDNASKFEQQVMIEALNKEMSLKEMGELMAVDARTLTTDQQQAILDFERKSEQADIDRALEYAKVAANGEEVDGSVLKDGALTNKVNKYTGALELENRDTKNNAVVDNTNTILKAEVKEETTEKKTINSPKVNEETILEVKEETVSEVKEETKEDNKVSESAVVEKPVAVSVEVESGLNSSGNSVSNSLNDDRIGTPVRETSNIEKDNLRTVIDKLLLGTNNQGDMLSLPVYIATILLTIFRDYLVVFLGLIIGLMVWQKVQGEQWGKVLVNGVGSATVLLASVFLTEGDSDANGNINKMKENSFYLVKAEREFIKIGEDMADRLWMTLIFGEDYLSETKYEEVYKNPSKIPTSFENGYFVQRYLQLQSKIAKNQLSLNDTLNKDAKYEQLKENINNFKKFQKDNLTNIFFIPYLISISNVLVDDKIPHPKSTKEVLDKVWLNITDKESGKKLLKGINDKLLITIDTTNDITNSYGFFEQGKIYGNDKIIPQFLYIPGVYGKKYILDLYRPLLDSSNLKPYEKALALSLSEAVVNNFYIDKYWLPVGTKGVRTGEVVNKFKKNLKFYQPDYEQVINTDASYEKIIDDAEDFYIKFIAEKTSKMTFSTKNLGDVVDVCTILRDKDGAIKRTSSIGLGGTTMKSFIPIDETWAGVSFSPFIKTCGVELNNFYSEIKYSEISSDNVFKRAFDVSIIPLFFNNKLIKAEDLSPFLTQAEKDADENKSWIGKIWSNLFGDEKANNKAQATKMLAFKDELKPLFFTADFNTVEGSMIDNRHILTKEADLNTSIEEAKSLIKSMDETVKKDKLHENLLKIMKTNPHENKEGNLISWMELGGVMGSLKDTYSPYVVYSLVNVMKDVDARGDIIYLENVIDKNSPEAKANAITKAVATVTLIKSVIKLGSDFFNDKKSAGIKAPTAYIFMFLSAGAAFLEAGFYILIAQMALIAVMHLLPAVIWMLAILSWYVKTAVIIAVLPLATFMLSFVNFQQIKTMILTLVSLMLTPIVLVSMYFILVEILSVLPILIDKFLPMLASVQSFTSLQDTGVAGEVMNNNITVSMFNILDSVLQITFLVKLFIELIISTILYTYFLKSSEYIQMIVGQSVNIGDETSQGLGKIQSAFKLNV